MAREFIVDAEPCLVLPCHRLSDGEKMDSISLMLYMSPVAAAALVPAAMLLEPSSIMAAREIAAENPCALTECPRAVLAKHECVSFPHRFEAGVNEPCVIASDGNKRGWYHLGVQQGRMTPQSMQFLSSGTCCMLFGLRHLCVSHGDCETSCQVPNPYLGPRCAGFLPLLALSSFGAYFQNVGNFLVTKYTSPLTLQACICFAASQAVTFSHRCHVALLLTANYKGLIRSQGPVRHLG